MRAAAGRRRARGGTRQRRPRPGGTSTGRRPSTLASTSTPAPTRSTTGARMNTAWNGSAAEPPATSRSVSNESTWRPKPLRRTVTSRRRSCAGRAGRRATSVASRISPAQVPNAGMPVGEPLGERRRRSPTSRAASTWWSTRRPGSTSASTPSRSAGVRTSTGVGRRARRGRRRARANVALQGEDADLRPSPGGPPDRRPAGPALPAPVGELGLEPCRSPGPAWRRRGPG